MELAAREGKLSSEAVKHDSDKVRLELIHPTFMFATAMVLTKGAEKYAPWNWAIGFHWSRVFGAMMRHLWAWYGGKGPTNKNFAFGDLDDEWQFSHLWHASCCLMFLIHHEEAGVGTDDRPTV